MNKLYKLKTSFLGKDLDEIAVLGYLIAESEEQVAEHINNRYCYGIWFSANEEDEEDEEEKEYTKQDFIANNGDFHTEYDGEFYDQKYGWEEIATLSGEVLFDLRIAEMPVKEAVE